METKYKRILLKLSGESLMGSQGYGIDPSVLTTMPLKLRNSWMLGASGYRDRWGNIFRGLTGATKWI